jgi:hypothetical protein
VLGLCEVMQAALLCGCKSFPQETSLCFDGIPW